MSAQAALVAAVRKLKAAGVADPARDARLLLAHAMGIGSDRLTLHLGDELSGEQIGTFDCCILQREKRQPVSQIIGARVFFGRSFKVTPDVLDPRPETEILIIEALKHPFSRVLDIGTGSGCIISTLLVEQPQAQGVGVDISEEALAVADENATFVGVSTRVEFVRSNWFDEVSGSFDLIVSNPPYIDEDEWQTLEPEPKDWEPKIALTPGPDGSLPYRIIAEKAPEYLSEGGRVLVEIGWKQGAQVARFFENQGFSDVRILSDLDGRDRVVCARMI